MKMLLFLLFLTILAASSAQEEVFWADLEKVYLTNVTNEDVSPKPALSKIRKLFYDGTLWDMVIPDAKDFKKPQDAISLAFQKSYAGYATILGESEDVKHMLGALNAYLYPKPAFGRDIAPHAIEYARASIMNYDLCSWLGDLASALAESHKQHISLEKAFAAYANTQDLKANIAAWHIQKLATPYLTESYKFPIIEVCRAHYVAWHQPIAKQELLRQYFASLGLTITQEGQTWKFSDAQKQIFYNTYMGQLKTAATAYYFSREDRFPFQDAECVTTLGLFLGEMEKFYNAASN